jgi:hypothetical protein
MPITNFFIITLLFLWEVTVWIISCHLGRWSNCSTLRILILAIPQPTTQLARSEMQPWSHIHIRPALPAIALILLSMQWPIWNFFILEIKSTCELGTLVNKAYKVIKHHYCMYSRLTIKERPLTFQMSVKEHQKPFTSIHQG